MSQVLIQFIQNLITCFLEWSQKGLIGYAATAQPKCVCNKYDEIMTRILERRQEMMSMGKYKGNNKLLLTSRE